MAGRGAKDRCTQGKEGLQGRDRVRCLEGWHGVKAMKVVQAHGRLERHEGMEGLQGAEALAGNETSVEA